MGLYLVQEMQAFSGVVGRTEEINEVLQDTQQLDLLGEWVGG